MKELDLIRFAYAPTGTFGYAKSEVGLLYTVERPWLSNQHSVSCIPEGSFTCTKRFFNEGGYYAVEIKSVPDRENILIHIANYPNDVEGCIGVGFGFGVIGRRIAILNSEIAFKAFMAVYGAEDFKLNISQIKGATL